MKRIRSLVACTALFLVPTVASSQITAAKAAAQKAVAAQNANLEHQITEGNSPTGAVMHAGQRISAPRQVASDSAVGAQAAAKAATVSAEAAGTVGPSSSSPTKGSSIPTQITIDREVFSYAGTGRRDPYLSLMTTTEIRPLLSDLRLTAIAFDPAGNNSVAILRDNVTKQQHRVKVGQQLGRLHVASIKVRSVVFTIDEFGFNRQETLQVRSDTTKTRTP
ncbi:MAG: hypothetical protein M3Y64_00120 [Gemmatimonadota bacterium]|nr:hypothetical protein [Gemmatimonadota bacterium]